MLIQGTPGESGSSKEKAIDLQQKNRRTALIASCFGVSMMLLSLVLPWFYGKKEPYFWLSVLQVALWLWFSLSWFWLGYRMHEDGNDLVVARTDLDKPKFNSSPAQRLIFLLSFVPSTFLYAYVTWENLQYLGFNYINFFVLAGFATQVFSIRTFVIYLLAQIAGWLLLGRLMWGGWMRVDDVIAAVSGYLFSSMMFLLLRRERYTRYRSEALTKELDAANAQLRQYSAQVEELSATQERNRIAREIHDTLGHSLTVVNMQLETANALIGTQPEKAAEFVQKAQAITKRGLGDVRDSVASLRSSPLDGNDFEGALKGLLDTAASSGIETKFELLGEPRPLGTQASLAIYRSVQEGLTNVRKHAKARRVELAVDYRKPERISIRLRDDGVGCEAATGGFGIMGIRERMQLLKGQSEVKTAPGEGLELRIEIPA